MKGRGGALELSIFSYPHSTSPRVACLGPVCPRAQFRSQLASPPTKNALGLLWHALSACCSMHSQRILEALQADHALDEDGRHQHREADELCVCAFVCVFEMYRAKSARSSALRADGCRGCSSPARTKTQTHACRTSPPQNSPAFSHSTDFSP